MTREASPDFRIGVTEHNYQRSEKIPSSKERLNRSHNGNELTFLTLNKNKPDKQSGPTDLKLHKEDRPSKTLLTKKKQLCSKSYILIY